MVPVERAARVTPRDLFRTFAIAEMITWAGLILALVLRAAGLAEIVPWAGGLHGFVFLCYAASTIFVWVNQRWPFGLGLTGLVLAIIPFATVPFEIYVDRRGLLQGGWRLAAGGDAPSGPIEHIQALVLRRPIISAVVLLGMVTLVFVVLLSLGPPIPKS